MDTILEGNDCNTYRRFALFQGGKNRKIVLLVQFKSIVTGKSAVTENVLDN